MNDELREIRSRIEKKIKELEDKIDFDVEWINFLSKLPTKPIKNFKLKSLNLLLTYNKKYRAFSYKFYIYKEKGSKNCIVRFYPSREDKWSDFHDLRDYNLKYMIYTLKETIKSNKETCREEEIKNTVREKYDKKSIVKLDKLKEKILVSELLLEDEQRILKFLYKIDLGIKYAVLKPIKFYKTDIGKLEKKITKQKSKLANLERLI